MERRLTRSADDRMLAGVAGGLAEYFRADATLVRLALVLFTLLGGSGILLYLLGWFLMPDLDGKRDPLPLALLVVLFVLPGFCCGCSWLGGGILNGL